jgi:hypothetical protein
MASILPTVADCCSTCCEVQIVDLPSGGGTGVNAYETIQALRNETSVTVLVNDAFAVVYGDTARGDGGGGEYYYDSSSTLPDDDISMIVPISIIRPAPGGWVKFFG